ncbi:MAG: Phosphoheptose isomerase [Acidobacteria bacterium]|nr:Phosphoheptose isomerase [Acidobacteriota bacterium]
MPETIEDFSRAFYPFLHESGQRRKEQRQELMEDLRFSLMEKARESIEVKQRFFEENAKTILAVSQHLARTFARGGKLLVCGNGGSATDAQHVAVEFMHPVTVGRKALPAICLVNDLAMVTAVANDVSFADVFTRQLIALGREGDALLAISTSGNSENLLSACATARRMKIATIGFSGGDGGRMVEMQAEGLLDFCLNAPTSSVHRIQETHVTLYHIVWDLTHTFLQRESLLEADDEVHR